MSAHRNAVCQECRCLVQADCLDDHGLCPVCVDQEELFDSGPYLVVFSEPNKENASQ